MTSKIGVKKIAYPNGTDAINVGASGNVSIASDYFGPPNWDSAGARPSVDSSNYGSLGYNIQKGGLEFWDVKNQQWSVLGVIDGSSPSAAFSTLSQVSNLGYTGYQDLYTTFGGNTSATKVKVDFGTTGGPYIVVSFAFNTTGGWNALNDTMWTFGNSDANNPVSSSGRSDDTANLGLGDGSTALRYLYGGDLGQTNTTYSSFGALLLETAVSSEYQIDYYNHATQADFTDSQRSAMQDWVSAMYTGIPHLAIEEDSQGLTSADAYNLATGPNSDSGHQVWIKDKDGNWLRVTTKDATTDESFSYYLWTHNSYADGASTGSLNSMNTGLTSTSGFNNISRQKCILPEKIAATTGTGGGGLFGTPNVAAFTQADGTSGNTMNSRRFFLIK